MQDHVARQLHAIGRITDQPTFGHLVRSFAAATFKVTRMAISSHEVEESRVGGQEFDGDKKRLGTFWTERGDSSERRRENGKSKGCLFLRRRAESV